MPSAGERARGYSASVKETSVCRGRWTSEGNLVESALRMRTAKAWCERVVGTKEHAREERRGGGGERTTNLLDPLLGVLSELLAVGIVNLRCERRIRVSCR